MKKLYLTILSAVVFTAFVHAQAPPPKFVNEIIIPPKIVYSNTPGVYDLDAIQTVHDFNPNIPGDPLNGVKTFAFEDFNNPGTTTILGPTVTWNYKDMLRPTVLNRLSERTTCHWHGAHVPNFADGGPYQVIQPDALWEPEFQVLDKSATMWYHPHAMDLTYKHVQMGLSGIIISEDPEDDPADPDDDLLVQIHEILPHDYAVNDFPLIFQTKFFEFDSTTNHMQIKSALGFKDGYEYMVNGIIDPYIDVPADMIRLRILNGDGKFSFNFSFDYGNGSAFPAQMIATDAGYMDRSYELDEILMAPGERTEWLLDLRGLQGDTLYIRNMVSNIPGADEPCPSNNQRGIIGDSCTTKGYAADRNLLKLIVGPSAGINSPIISFPIPLHPSETPPMSEVTNQRKKVFRKDNFGALGNLFNIDSTLMNMMVVNDVVMLGATEIWTIENTTEIAHPWHIHDIHFWVTEIKDSDGTILNPDDHPELFKGPKDNVLVQPGWTLSYIGSFEDFGVGDPSDPTNSYMYHCHILPHEDNGMMGTFVVFDPALDVEDDSDLSAISMKVQPNPAQDVLYMHGASEKVSTLRFIDLNGRLIKEMTLPAFEGAIQIETDNFPSGMLIMDWRTVEGQATNKVMIHR